MMFLRKSEVLASSDRQSDIRTGILNYTVAKLLLRPKKCYLVIIFKESVFARLLPGRREDRKRLENGIPFNTEVPLLMGV